jgi:hypothetical protein
MGRGISMRSISVSTGISRATLRDWREHPVSANPRAVCPRCAPSPVPPEPQADYAYLLGLYLGDGCISLAGARNKKVWNCASHARMPARPPMRVRAGHECRTAGQQGSYPAADRMHRSDQLFPALAVPVPAARTGPQHLRKIELQPWQRIIVTAHADRFARGLFHSDGYRGINRVRAPLTDGDHWYEYPRYLFTNESADILRLCGEALDRLGGGLALLAAQFDLRGTARGGGAAR